MLSLIIDFGLLILIWMTQLIVYPSFNYYTEAQLLEWHKLYTSKITLIVLPLMFLQVFFHGLTLLESFSFWSLSISVLIALAWINTFFYAVPLHNKITSAVEIKASAKNLVYINWYRTVFWTAAFTINLINYYINHGKS